MSIKEGKNRALRGEILVLMLGAVLAGCGGGGGVESSARFPGSGASPGSATVGVG